MEMQCPECNFDIEVEYGWEHVGDEYVCSSCGTNLFLDVEETWDEESGEEYVWFFLERND